MSLGWKLVLGFIAILILSKIVKSIFYYFAGDPTKVTQEQRMLWRQQSIERDKKSREKWDRDVWMASHDSGEIGERFALEQLSTISGMKVLQSVYIPLNNDHHTEIDLIGLHHSGVYVVESKNYRGVIVGEETDQRWNHAFEDGSKDFYNPIMQNNGHIEAVKKFLGNALVDVPVYSLIVFGDHCNISLIKSTSPNVFITKYGSIVEQISSILGDGGSRLSEDRYVDIFTKLEVLTQVSDEIKARHLAYVQAKQA
jgi:hypothetical protein